jgi:AraC family transcriptional regulator
MKPEIQCKDFHGETVASHLLAGLQLSERTYPPGFNTGRHAHQRAYLCLILDGASVQTYGLKTRVREPFMTLFYPPNEVQSEHFKQTGGRIFSVEMESVWLQRFREHGIIQDYSTSFQNGLMAWLMTRLYHEFCAIDQISSLAIEGITLEIIAEASRRSAKVLGHPRTHWLETVRDILHTQFADGLTLAGIAESVGVHPVYLAGAFRKRYRCTIGEYVRQLRIEFACREISKADVPLAEVALAAGFSNQAHFTRTFRRLMGMTPTQYRRIRSS